MRSYAGTDVELLIDMKKISSTPVALFASLLLSFSATAWSQAKCGDVLLQEIESTALFQLTADSAQLKIGSRIELEDKEGTYTGFFVGANANNIWMLDPTNYSMTQIPRKNLNEGKFVIEENLPPRFEKQVSGDDFSDPFSRLLNSSSQRDEANAVINAVRQYDRFNEQHRVIGKSDQIGVHMRTTTKGPLASLLRSGLGHETYPYLARKSLAEDFAIASVQTSSMDKLVDHLQTGLPAIVQSDVEVLNLNVGKLEGDSIYERRGRRAVPTKYGYGTGQGPTLYSHAVTALGSIVTKRTLFGAPKEGFIIITDPDNGYLSFYRIEDLQKADRSDFVLVGP
jgi:hypothetical protein